MSKNILYIYITKKKQSKRDWKTAIKNNNNIKSMFSKNTIQMNWCVKTLIRLMADTNTMFVIKKKKFQIRMEV